MGGLRVNSRHQPDWLVPKPVLCAFFWCGILFLFSGIVLLILSRNRGEDYRSWGGVFLGLGFMFMLMCLILCLFAYCVITAEDGNKRRVPWIKTYFEPPVRSKKSNLKTYEEVPLKQVISEPSPPEPVYSEPLPKDSKPVSSSNGTPYREPNGTVYTEGVTTSTQRTESPYADIVVQQHPTSPHHETIVYNPDTEPVQSNGSPNRFQVADNGSPIATDFIQSDNGGQDNTLCLPDGSRVVSRDSASPNGNVSSDSSMRSRSNSTGSKTVSFRNPVVSAQIGKKKKGKQTQKIEELPPTGKKEKDEEEVPSIDDDSDYDEDELPATPPFPEWELANYGDYSEYGLPYNPAFDPNVKSAISEYDLIEEGNDEDFESKLESSNVLAYTDVPVRRGGTGKKFRDDTRRFSNPIKVHLRGKNFGLSQVSLYDNVRYVMD